MSHQQFICHIHTQQIKFQNFTGTEPALRHLDVLHLLIEECRHLANDCIAKYNCIGFMIFRYLSYVWAQYYAI